MQRKNIRISESEIGEKAGKSLVDLTGFFLGEAQGARHLVLRITQDGPRCQAQPASGPSARMRGVR